MPHLVEMQKKYGKEGLVVVLMEMERASNQGARQSAKQILSDNGATETVNLALAQGADPMDWFRAYGTEAIPFSIVLDRKGKVQKQGNLEHAEIEEAVQELLNEKK
jgi:hypothetical protein